ncbi:hypothetical protein HPB52_003498 [Rhipicephalus sanguineus]|uniref:Uncharacterized protein n=1 Tax=Rhipicephalus sanguineus TaxID=34632 RepID=A0A9D4T8G6_RHISA|nr:hypothetical protein HPB52_003498 [Rhipicephalus sanguineus]
MARPLNREQAFNNNFRRILPAIAHDRAQDQRAGSQSCENTCASRGTLKIAAEKPENQLPKVHKRIRYGAAVSRHFFRTRVAQSVAMSAASVLHTMMCASPRDQLLSTQRWACLYFAPSLLRALAETRYGRALRRSQA